MGRRMVPHLLKAGFEVFVCDPDSDAVAAVAMHGAARCETPRHVADNADIVLVCLPRPDIVEQVVLGNTGIRHGQRVGVIVDHSTTGPSVARKCLPSRASPRSMHRWPAAWRVPKPGRCR